MASIVAVQPLRGGWLVGTPLRAAVRPGERVAGRSERRGAERRQLLLAQPPGEERRVFDRRADDRVAGAESLRARASIGRKGLLIDIYV